MIGTSADDIEPQRRIVQAALDKRKSAHERNRTGQFATPYPLALSIAEAVKPLLPLGEPYHLVEPACGSGAFFSAAVSAFCPGLLASATGIEIDGELATAAHNLWDKTGVQIIEGDFTRLKTEYSSSARPNILLANPPYVRHHHLDTEEKQRLRQRAHEATGIHVSGLAGLYVYFILLAHTWIKEGGIASWLIPAEFMDVNYGTALRQYFSESVTLMTVHRFDPSDTQFADALVSSAVVTYRKTLPHATASVTFSYGGLVSKPEVKEKVPLAQLRREQKWGSHPRREKVLTADRPRNGCTFGDLFTIRRGLATGANDFFILERGRAHALQLPSEFLVPVLPSPRQIKHTHIRADAEKYPILPQQHVLIDCHLPEQEVQERYPELWSYLQTGKESGIQNRYLVGKRTPWYRQEQRRPSPFICTYMGRGTVSTNPIRFLLNESRAVVTNVYLNLYPGERLTRLLEEKPGAGEEVIRALNAVSTKDIREAGRVYGGGLQKLEPGELSHIPADIILDQFPELALPFVGHGCHTGSVE